MTMRGLVILASSPTFLLKKAIPLAGWIEDRFLVADQPDPLYITVQPSVRSQLTNGNVEACSQVAATLYTLVKPQLDLRIVLGDKPSYIQVSNETMNQVLGTFIKTLFTKAETIDLDTLQEVPPFTPDHENCLSDSSCDKIYEHVVLGGTFDRLHPGHKILLTSALARCSTSLTVGVTGPGMLANKTLPELIAPIDQRLEDVRQFLGDVDSSVGYNVVEIQDPFGPSIVDPLLQCIVGSEETRKGCLAVNDRRKERGLSQLDIHIIR